MKFSHLFFPGTMGLAASLLGLFGKDRVDVGQWLGPVRVYDLTTEELDFLKELYETDEITIKPENTY